MDLHEEIEKVAYEIYENSGRVEGRSAENWFEAERVVRERRQKRAGGAAIKEPAQRPAAKAPAKKPAAPRAAAPKSRSRI